MYKILLSISLVLLSCAPFLISHAACTGSNNNVTSQSFIVVVGCMDPLGDSHGNVSSIQSGIGAFRTVLTRVTDILLFMIPLIAWVSLLIAGYYYIFSAGDSEKANKAKTIIKWNIIAILVAFLSYGIVSIVASFFNT